jgi:hypothetical protein
MHDTSARLVERGLPSASYRQWVLTVAFPLRLRIARDPGDPVPPATALSTLTKRLSIPIDDATLCAPRRRERRWPDR